MCAPLTFLTNEDSCYLIAVFRLNSSRLMEGTSSGTTVAQLFTTRRTWGTLGGPNLILDLELVVSIV